VGVAALLLSLSLTDRGLWDERGVGDTGHYQQYGERVIDGELPYRDFYIEFPPAAVPVLALPALGPDDRYVRQFKALESLFLALTLVLLAVTLVALGASTRRAALLTALAGIAPGVLGPIAISSFDPWPALWVSLAVAALVLGRTATGFAALAIGVAAKLYPLLLLPLALAHAGRAKSKRALVAFVGAGLALAAPFAILAPGGLRFSLETQATRGLQFESLGGSALLVADRLGIYDARIVVGAPYSLDLAGRLADVVGGFQSVAQLAAVALALALYLRGPSTPARLGIAATATVVGLVALGKVLSPQYLVWLIPLVPLGGLAPTALLLAACALTHVWFPGRFDELQAAGGVSWVALLRNLLLVALFALLLARLRRERPAAPPAAGS
jgi:hypothetical protein